ncbi:MAG: tRNA (adenosine(37)-N6)-dimethylallyltransferase MiaA [Candidatus Paceibacterota bacterium]|jgi:tRNA dimethylallyltransferase
MENKELNKVLIILGPTASGKSEWAVKLASRFNGEIISADSRQVYRGLDIGTGKVPRGKYQELEKNRQEDEYCYKGIKHYLIDVVEPNKDFTVVDYKRLAEKAIKEILSRGKLPIVCGGTGLYIRALTENLSIPKVKIDLKLRQKLEAEMEKYGLERLAGKLKEIDPLSAQTVDLKNPRRVIRALEVIINSGKSFSSQQKRKKSKYEFLELGIKIPDQKLKENISKRVEKMFKQGLVEETKKIVQKYRKGIKALNTIGYKEVIDFLEGKISKEEAKEKIKMNTWHYAKRQMTWFKKDKKINWIDDFKSYSGLIDDFISR